MTKEQAIRLRDFLKKQGLRVAIPRGTTRVRLIWNGGVYIFENVGEYKAFAKAENQKLIDFVNKHCPQSRPRSPIEIMIDKVCGVE